MKIHILSIIAFVFLHSETNRGKELLLLKVKKNFKLEILNDALNDSADSSGVIMLRIERSKKGNKSNGVAKNYELRTTIIVKAITKVGSVGAEERFFRYEGLKSDNVLALPPHYIIETDLRLYLLRYSESVVIFGNGGIKDVRVYQDDTYLNKCVTVLQRVDEQTKILIQSGDITIDGKTITGETDFTIYT